jgi:hypothetical protein
MAISEACKFEIKGEVDGMLERGQVETKSAAFDAMVEFYRQIGIEISKKTIETKYYRATPSNEGNEETPTETTPCSDGQEKSDGQPRPLCKCGAQVEKGRTKKDGTVNYFDQCRSCRRKAKAEAAAPQEDDEPKDLCGLAILNQDTNTYTCEKRKKPWDIFAKTYPCDKCKHFVKRDDEAEPVQPHKITKAPTQQPHKTKKEDIVSEDFEKAYQAFYWQVQNAKLEKWANTSREACLKMLGWINDLIRI